MVTNALSTSVSHVPVEVVVLLQLPSSPLSKVQSPACFLSILTSKRAATVLKLELRSLFRKTIRMTALILRGVTLVWWLSSVILLVKAP